SLHDVVDLVGINGFPLEQGRSHGFHLVAVFFDQLACHTVLLVDDAADLLVDLLHGGLGYVRGLCHAASKKDLAFVFGIDHGAKGFCHAVTHDDIACNGGGPLKVVGCTGRHLIHEDFFGNTPAKQDSDHVEQMLLVHAVAVLFMQL